MLVAARKLHIRRRWRLASFPERALRSAIVFYQRGLSPLLGRNCRFYPTCSRYALEALSRHGALRGGLLAVKRILRCHPFHPGGVDPVPESVPQADSRRHAAD